MDPVQLSVMYGDGSGGDGIGALAGDNGGRSDPSNGGGGSGGGGAAVGAAEQRSYRPRDTAREAASAAAAVATTAGTGHAHSPLALPTVAILNRQTTLTVPPLEPTTSQPSGDPMSVIASTAIVHGERS